jgi:hypothetical protein
MLYNAGFTEGGDLTIQSSDGIDFSVHSLFLSEASPIFSELLKPDNRAKLIKFSDDAEVLALTLKFIYPKPTPVITSMRLLDDAVRVANTYQLESMRSRLREQLVLVDSPVSVYNNPFGALCVAATHDFVPEAKLAAELSSRKYTFEKEGDLRDLVDATRGPATAALVKLTGVPLVKTRVLVDVLFHFERKPMSLSSNTELFCANCRETFRDTSRQSPPEWQSRWALWTFNEAKDRVISEWRSLFNSSAIRKAFCQSHLSLTVYCFRKFLDYRTCTCLDTIGAPQNESALQNWLNGVYEHLKSRLALMEELEASTPQDPKQ